MHNIRILTVSFLAVLFAGGPASAAPLLDELFQDHAVLQRDKALRVWGKAPPGTQVTVTIGPETAQGEADTHGDWLAALPALAAGGPYSLSASASDGERETANDVLIGDVWLCSGQSNMELPVKAAIDAGADIATAANNAIRLLTVPANASPAPLDRLAVPVKWLVSAPATVPDFSAACYFMGRDLQQVEKIPVGLIASDWGGANITTYMSEPSLRKTGGYEQRLDALDLYAKDPSAGMAQWGRTLENWWRAHLSGEEPWTESAENWPRAPSGLGYWTEWGVPELAHYVGQVWFRTTVTLTPDQAAQPAELSLGLINEEDQTWVNGKFIATTFAFGAERRYALAPGTLHAGVNAITVEVLCTWRGCGMFGPPQNRFLRLAGGTTVPLDDTWRYRITPGSAGQAPRVPWGSVPGLSMAYNAMVAPLTRYAVRGVAWYQGESNTGAPSEYNALLSGLMTGWRTAFGSDLPFLIVQLPDYGLPPITPVSSSGWAELRESQRAAVAADGNAALVVTIDIGSHYGLHPANKQEVGRRLALAARRLAYGEQGVPAGPTAVSAVRGGGSVIVRFVNADQGLVAYNAREPIGFELCPATKSGCAFVGARIVKDAVRLTVPGRTRPAYVRYCWADGPECTLFDGARLPAGPFILPIGGAQPTVHRARHRRHFRHVRPR